MYISRRYLREKWEIVKWDMEKVLDIYNKETDKISEEDVKRCYEIKDNIDAIVKELGL